MLNEGFQIIDNKKTDIEFHALDEQTEKEFTKLINEMYRTVKPEDTI